MVQIEKTVGEAIFSLDTLGCSNCTQGIEAELGRRMGIYRVELNSVAGTVRINFDPSKTTPDAIRNYLKQLCQESQGKAKIDRGSTTMKL